MQLDNWPDGLDLRVRCYWLASLIEFRTQEEDWETLEDLFRELAGSIQKCLFSIHDFMAAARESNKKGGG